jgi:hypothetical protein
VNRPASPYRRFAGLALLALPLLLAACSSGPSLGGGSGSPNSRLQSQGVKVISQMATYASTASACNSASSPVVCLEKADRTLGNQVHAYANTLAVGKGFSAPQNDIVNARNSAQTLANSLEILGDAQPTQSNYNQVLNTFDLNGAIAQLHGEVQKLDRALGG